MSEGSTSEYEHDHSASEYGMGLAQRLTKLLRKGFGCDVEFIVGDEKEVVLAHKLVLASSSEVFSTMFYGELARSK
ncbi:unnamed protein product [Gongylonema pulchrum]|uniref:BTB domain-containing protein n=1 Tax=Gongylonema pulchrum TaxID=637853 RepID=A0A183ERR9_9BILA|nr:unnamed protein product [Gongylonema pulchrum]